MDLSEMVGEDVGQGVDEEVFVPEGVGFEHEGGCRLIDFGELFLRHVDVESNPHDDRGFLAHWDCFYENTRYLFAFDE